MSEDFGKKVRRFASVYDRGVITASEFVHKMLDACADFNPSDEEINAVFRDVPDELIDTLQSELHKLANVDFYCRTFAMEDSRTEDEVQANALARQPRLRRTCEVLTPLMTERSKGRYFTVVTPSPEDIARARDIALTECPRRYCWWWRTLSFDWETTPAEGCRFLESPKLPSWQYADISCCRSDASSDVDHYEPREPHLEADGFHKYRFCEPQDHQPDNRETD